MIIVIIKLALTNVKLKLDVSSVDSYDLLMQIVIKIFVMTWLSVLIIAATEMRIKHRKHNRWKRHSLSTYRYYLYDTKERCSRIGIKRHLRKLYQHPFLLQRAGSIIACSAASTSDPNHPSQVSFDTDSFIIGDDNI